MYRPLHSLSIWVGYRIFGVRAFPNQLLSLLLHFFNVLLLYKIVQKVGGDAKLAFLAAAVALVSIYTASPASWVSDRSTLIVGLALLLFLDHLLKDAQSASEIRPWYIVLLSVIALLSKEGGLIVPFFALFASVLCLPSSNRSRNKTIVASLMVISAYLILRLMIFHSVIGSFSESGYIFGVRAYDNWASLPRHLQLWALVENVIKNFLATLLPVFNNSGGLQLSHPMIWIPTLLLAGSVLSFKLTLPQKLSVIILVLNSGIHSQIFRYRIQYIPLLAFCLFVGASPMLREHASRRFIAQGAAALLVVGSIFVVNQYLQNHWLTRYQNLNNKHLSTIIEKYPDQISPQVVEQVLDRYSDRK
ncbi:MAG: glycosyltransferase family 39 protein [Pyrinomonadaceae bacterium]|nr:glycosyltransferase family 39 protein [Pyrinomonadaceae bacterium]